MEFVLKLIVFLPLISGIINGIFCKKFTNSVASTISSIAIVISAICSVMIFIKAGINKETMHVVIANWINTYELYINWSLYVDQLTAIMC